MRTLFVQTLTAAEIAILCYFFALNSLYLVFSVVAYFRLRTYRRRWTARELAAVVRSPATPAISVVVPAHDEEHMIVESVRSLLLLNYPEFEVVVINDGSSDNTLQQMIGAFDLVRAPITVAPAIPTRPVRAMYRSLHNPDLVLIDKENGGKADALNAGINSARHSIVCVIDADSLLEEHSLTRAVLPFIEDPTTIATGGIVRVVNGCQVEAGRVVRIRLPKNRLALFQVVEYLRSFLAARVTHSALNALLIISGAFGLFRRDALIEVGGLRQDSIGEDMELVTRLHALYKRRKQPYRIVFQPDPVCWTEAPESREILERQRNRWQRGALQVLTFHRSLIGNPRYGTVGLLAMPYYLIFEVLGPIVELVGYLITILATALGLLNWQFAELLFLTAIVYGCLISVAAVLLEEMSFRRYARLTDLLRLVLFAVLENFGYRQLTLWWRLEGTIDFLLNRQSWGTMTRKGFARA